jgi:hypothetical protein
MKFQDKIKKAKSRKEETVEVDGVKWLVRAMSGEMRDYFTKDGTARVKFDGQDPDINSYNPIGQRALVVAMGLVDDDSGELAFDYTNAEHITEINTWDSELLKVLEDKISKISGLEKEAKEAAEKKLELEAQSGSGSK